jgi:hypothetical protein
MEKFTKMHDFIDQKERLNYNENHMLTSWAKIANLIWKQRQTYRQTLKAL